LKFREKLGLKFARGDDWKFGNFEKCLNCGLVRVSKV